jgi:hypothetical protein
MKCYTEPQTCRLLWTSNKASGSMKGELVRQIFEKVQSGTGATQTKPRHYWAIKHYSVLINWPLKGSNLIVSSISLAPLQAPLFFLGKKALECKEWSNIWLERGGISYTDARKKGSRTPFQLVSGVLLWQNGIMARSIITIPVFIRTLELNMYLHPDLLLVVTDPPSVEHMRVAQKVL